MFWKKQHTHTQNPIFHIRVLAKASVTKSFIFWVFYKINFHSSFFPPRLCFPSLCCLTSVKSCTVALFHVGLCQNDTQLFCPSLPLVLLYKLWSIFMAWKPMLIFTWLSAPFFTQYSIQWTILLVFSPTKLFSLFLWNFNVNLNSSCCQIFWKQTQPYLFCLD